MGIPISAGSTILGLLDHLHHLMTFMPRGVGGISARPRGGSEEWLPVTSGLYGITELILVDRVRDSAPNLPHPEGAIRCSVEHSSKRCGCVASHNKHDSTVAHPFGPPEAGTARRALPYTISLAEALNAQRAKPVNNAHLVKVVRKSPRTLPTDGFYHIGRGAQH